MDSFVIFLCIVIGHVSCGLEREKIDKEDLKFNEGVSEIVPLVPFDDANISINPGQNLPEVNDHKGDISAPIVARYKNAGSSEIGTLKSPSPILNVSNLTSGSSKTTKSWQRVHYGTPAKHFQLFWKLTHRNFARQDLSANSVDSLHRAIESSSRREKHVTGKLFRRKRGLYDMDGAWTASAEEHRVLIEKLPDELEIAMAATDNRERFLLDELSKDRNRWEIDKRKTEFLENRNAERKVLRKYMEEAKVNATAQYKGPELLANYKAVRKGEPWLYRKLYHDYIEFFKTPSTFLTEFEDLIRGELDIDSYLNGTLQRSPHPENKVQEAMTEKQKIPNDERARTEETTQVVGLLQRAYDPNDPSTISLEKKIALSKKLPRELKSAFAATDHYAHHLLAEFALGHSKEDLDTIKSLYIEKRNEERKTLKKLVEEAGSNGAELLANYKALRTGEAWVHTKLNHNFAGFFKTPSKSLTEYEDLMRGELDIDSYLSGTVQTSKSEGPVPVKVDNSVSITESCNVVQFLLSRLPEVLKSKMLITDESEKKLLENYAKSQSVSSEVLDAYKSAKKNEIRLLERVLAEANSYAPYILEIYRSVRKGKAWKCIKHDEKFRAFFETPSAALTEYEALKQDELDTMPNVINQPFRAMALGENEREEADEVDRRARVKTAERARTQEDEKIEEMERKVRAQKTEGRATEKIANIEMIGDIVAVTQDIRRSTAILRSSKNVTSAQIMDIKNIANSRAGDNTNAVGIAILLSVSINVTLVTLILGLYRKKLVDWYMRMKMARATSADEETEPLYPGRKASTPGTIYAVMKTTPDAIMSSL